MPTMETEDLFADMLAEGLYVERRLTEVLPELAGKASDPDLAEMFRHHLDETREQLANLVTIADSMDEKLVESESRAFEGLVMDAEQAMARLEDPGARDACLIAAALKNEHMEMGFYEGMITLAESLKLEDAIDLLKANLEQEQHTARDLVKKERELAPA